ncbi:MAG: hypothetical protein JNM93_12565 [Bacteriovoracaceae bacterium]|nr:hypothetical protein [Bacteriovoracaceae bacterium]
MLTPDSYQTTFQDLIQNIELSRKGFQASGSDSEALRSTADAVFVLEAYRDIYESYLKLTTEFPSMDVLVERDFGHPKEIFEREFMLETAFIADSMFPISENFPIEQDSVFSQELVNSYKKAFADWCVVKRDFHIETQKLLKENFTLKLAQPDLSCQCFSCLGDFRSKVRDSVMSEHTELMEKLEEEIYEKIVSSRINQISDRVAEYRKQMDKSLTNLRYRLRRGSLKKLDQEIRDLFKSKFDLNSKVGQVYREKLISFFNSLLVEHGHKPEMITEEEYQRFLGQMGVGIWKGEAVLRKEFEKFLKSILTFKRKDISSNILKDYLGQFWLHSEARTINRKIIYHMGPTNSGKTYHAIQALCEAKSGCYLAPLRLLASELYDTMNAKGVKTTLLTGEEVIKVPDATHFSSTIEMARLNEDFDCCVIDEIQMISDPQRGWAWTRALVNIKAPEIHICGDPSVFKMIEELTKLTGDTLEIKNYTRMTELKIMDKTINLSALNRSDALIVFSRRNALKYKADLEDLDFKVSVVYGRLSPEVRREQARKFDEGETDIMVATDAIAMGMNLPIKRIIFSSLTKHVDNKEIEITPSEIKQIAGRAGRYKRFPVGEVTCLSRVEHGIEDVRNALAMELQQKTMVMVGPDLDIFSRVNKALEDNALPALSLPEFLRLFNAMTFIKPFYCVDLKEMIELAEMVEEADSEGHLTSAEVFGFTCAPVNLGLIEHVQYYIWILNGYVTEKPIENEDIEVESDNIDYLETAIKCVELYQWLARHFDGKNFQFEEEQLLHNKTQAIERLNELLSDKIARYCSSCSVQLPDKHEFNICENCFGEKKKSYRRGPSDRGGRDNREHRGDRSRNDRNDRNESRSSNKPNNNRGPRSENRFEKKSKGPKANAFKKFR